MVKLYGELTTNLCCSTRKEVLCCENEDNGTLREGKQPGWSIYKALLHNLDTDQYRPFLADRGLSDFSFLLHPTPVSEVTSTLVISQLSSSIDHSTALLFPCTRSVGYGAHAERHSLISVWFLNMLRIQYSMQIERNGSIVLVLSELYFSCWKTDSTMIWDYSGVVCRVGMRRNFWTFR
jgi:hypothetical protein